ncbi:MAG: hypothetical protein PHU94_01340 [Bacilli bacterium]|nr:hypothetical protein [Bacilli bacterium]MDD4718861.1 hypothetical protein [Bacilli bacterium]
MSVEKTLKTVIEIVNMGKFDFIPTSKNLVSKRKYALSHYDIEDFIKSLESTDLMEGPTEDRDCPGEYLYIFKREILPGILFYVKFKIKNGEVKCLSCHEYGQYT